MDWLAAFVTCQFRRGASAEPCHFDGGASIFHLSLTLAGSRIVIKLCFRLCLFLCFCLALLLCCFLPSVLLLALLCVGLFVLILLYR